MSKFKQALQAQNHRQKDPTFHWRVQDGNPAGFSACHNLQQHLPPGELLMRSLIWAVLFLCLLQSFVYIQAAEAGKPLQFYFVDMEGGQATLVVSPSGE